MYWSCFVLTFWEHYKDQITWTNVLLAGIYLNGLKYHFSSIVSLFLFHRGRWTRAPAHLLKGLQLWLGASDRSFCRPDRRDADGARGSLPSEYSSTFTGLETYVNIAGVLTECFFNVSDPHLSQPAARHL